MMKRLQSAESKRSIKLDYSDAYLENEALENELDNKISGLQKAKYKAGIDRDEGLEKARREAEEIQKLSEAVKKQGKRDDYLRENSSKTRKKESSKADSPSELEEDISMNIKVSDSKTDDKKDSISASEDTCRIKPVNIGMFKLNIRNFRRKITDMKAMPKTIDIANLNDFRNEFTRKSQSANLTFNPRRRRPDVPPPSFLRPKTMKPKKAKEGEVLEAMDIQPYIVHGVHVRKNPSTRSRRELQEISKIQQEEKFGKPDRKLEERKRVEAWAKGDGGLEIRVKKFLDDLEKFKKKERESEFPLLQMIRTSSLELN